MIEDHYKTILKPGEALFKDRGSKFYGYAFPVEDETALKDWLKTSKQAHHTARHHCYAFKINPLRPYFRGNDDGEPSNSAGTPILNQIISNDLMNVAVVVVRYFGGTKLGVSGLINAYKTAAADAIANAVVVEKTLTRNIQFNVSYADINRIMRVIKERGLNIVNQESLENATITLEIALNDYDQVLEYFKTIHYINLKEKE